MCDYVLCVFSRGAPQDDVESMEVETALPADGGEGREGRRER